MNTKEVEIIGPFVGGWPESPDPSDHWNPIKDIVRIGGTIVFVHLRKDCVKPCAIHAPSDHHMRHLPMRWRQDRQMIERVCSHGIGHPDPDQVAYWEYLQEHLDTERAAWLSVHGCCEGKCCVGTH